MKEVFYTLIIPHHNIPALLKRCLASIPQRSDLQVIVVDDNSDAQYREDLTELSKEFPHVEFLWQDENGGGGRARNIGMKHAKGKYILFADADDYFTYCLNEVLDDYRNCDADIVYFDAISLDTDSYKVSYRVRHLNRMMINYKKHHKSAEKELRYIFGEPWCRLIKRSVIEEHNITFDEYIIHNDRKFGYLTGHYCTDVQVDQRVIYVQTVRSGSVSKLLSFDRLMIRTKVYGKLNQFYRENHIGIYEEKALRPMMTFLLHGQFNEYNKCKIILKDCGMSTGELLYRQIIYPFMLAGKIWVNVKEILIRLKDVSK